jgi:hypothetical protein
MVKERKKFENMKNYDNDDYAKSANFTSDREKASTYYNLLVVGKLLLNVTVLVVFIIIL